jgi:hypothetical protein
MRWQGLRWLPRAHPNYGARLMDKRLASRWLLSANRRILPPTFPTDMLNLDFHLWDGRFIAWWSHPPDWHA